MAVTLKPMQRDMFTGNLVHKPPKAGRGGHLRLKNAPGDKYLVPGMAYFAGTGPEGKRCRHCKHLDDIKVWRGRGGQDCSTPELAGQKLNTPAKRIEADACRKACEMCEGIVQPGGIQFEAACKYFEPRE